jgi:hypothetical protein
LPKVILWLDKSCATLNVFENYSCGFAVIFLNLLLNVIKSTSELMTKYLLSSSNPLRSLHPLYCRDRRCYKKLIDFGNVYQF